MINPTQHILHRSVPKEKLNILCGTTHERQNSLLAKTGHNFYSVKLNQHFKKWDNRYGIMPQNWIELPDNHIPDYLSFDLVLIQHIFGQYQELIPIAKQMHIPTIRLEHTTYVWDDNGKMAKMSNQMRGDFNIFITNDSVQKWQWQDRGDTAVIHHCVDIDLFCPDNIITRDKVILTVANDYIGRDYVLGYTRYKNTTAGLPVRPIGDTPGLSKPSKSIEELIKVYNTSRIFLNTAHLSPIPSSLLEAAAMECAIVSLNACGVSEFFTDGHDAFLVSSDQEMRERLELLLVDDNLCKEMGKNARQTIIKKCSMDRFVNDWNKVFNIVIQ